MKKTLLLIVAIMFCITTVKAQNLDVDNQAVVETTEDAPYAQAIVDMSFMTENAEAILNMTEEERNASIDMFLAKNKKYFKKKDMGRIRDMLMGLDDSKLKSVVMYAEDEFKNPTTILAVSIVVPILTFNLLSGLDRILLGEVGWGILKTITYGGFGIWTIVDWFIITGKTHDYNMERLKEACGVYY